jgi:hypothetical protein
MSEVFAALFGFLVAAVPVLAAETDPSAEQVVNAAAERATYGLRSDVEYVRMIMETGQDVGTSRLGMVMTAAEEEALDLPGRAAFANEVAARLVPLLARSETSGGIYLDQRRGAVAVVSFTERGSQLEADIRREAAGMSRAVEVRYVQFSDHQLTLAVQAAWAAWEGDSPILGASLDYEQNAIVLDLADPAGAGGAVAALSARLDVEVIASHAEDSTEVACTTRNNCWDPSYRAGIMVRRGSTTADYRCTMGFHIAKGTDEQWLTAGHCGYEGSNSWYHKASGLIGTEQATLYVPNGIDAMRVQLPDDRASNKIYDRTLRVTSSRDPVQGEGVCASLAVSDAWDCGTVSSVQTSWIGDACQCVIWGADHDGIPTQLGDSGSPIVNNVTSGSYIAIGIHNTSGGKFAKVGSVLSSFSASLYVP